VRSEGFLNVPTMPVDTERKCPGSIKVLAVAVADDTPGGVIEARLGAYLTN
jgi:hypothetical protein